MMTTTTTTGRRFWLGIAAAALVAFVVACVGQGGDGQGATAAQMDEDISFDPDAGGPTDLALRDPILEGAIDVHGHLAPDMSGGGQTARAMNTIEMARAAQAVGMRGFVHKTHMDVGSAGYAYLARQEVPGVEVFARFALNLTVGGINPAAVMQFINISGGYGRIVEFPTRDTNQPDPERRPWVLPWASTFPDFPKSTPIAENGELVPNVKALIALLPKLKTVDSNGRVVMATGHASPENHVLLAREARAQGVEVMLTHPGGNVTMDMKKEVASLGGYIEVMADFNQWGGDAREKADYAAEVIKGVGAEHVIFGSDCGQMDNPFPTDCYVLAARALRARGISDRELDVIAKENPAKYLGLPPPPSATND